MQERESERVCNPVSLATAAEQSGACALLQAATLEILKSWEGGSDVWRWAWALRTVRESNSSAMHRAHNRVSHSTAALKEELADTQAHAGVPAAATEKECSLFIILSPLCAQIDVS
ncbi:uncharacterized [Tachysurus ichikawai]